MGLNYIVYILSILLTGILAWVLTSAYYQKKLIQLTAENSELKNKSELNENIINEVKLAFSKIAQESLKNQQDELVAMHSKDLITKMDLFKAEEIKPIREKLEAFKESIDKYQQTHHEDTLDIKNAIAIAEKYAKALTTSQNSKGQFGEQWLEQILEFANLKENVHYTKQFSSDSVKPDFVVKLPNEKHLVIDSKVILDKFINYQDTKNSEDKKAFLSDLTKCINQLSQKNYEEIDELNQPGFILMYIPIENCVNMIYTDIDFKDTVKLANVRNIIIVGTSSLLVTLRLVNQLWASKKQNDHVQNIIKTGENLYNNIATHANILVNIKDAINNASDLIQKEINRFTARNKGSIFKEAEKLVQYGIEAKGRKSGKKIQENKIPEIFIDNETDYDEDDIGENE